MTLDLGRARSWLDDLHQDLRFGLRLLLKHPGLSAVVLLTLALGIGANTAIFSVVNAVLLRPLPFPDAQRLVQVVETHPGRGLDSFAVSVPTYRDFQEQSRSFDALAATKSASVTVRAGSDPARVPAQFVTANTFAAFGVRPTWGRAFRQDEDDRGARAVVILSQDFWRRSLDADPHVLGRAIEVDGESHTIVGITPALLPADAALFLPLSRFPWPEADAPQQRGDRLLTVVGRLKPGVTHVEAAAEMAALSGRIEAEHPDTNAGWQVLVVPFIDVVVGRGERRVVLLLFAAVVGLLLIAAANLANVLLVHAARRTQELTIRAALGSSRGRHIRQLLTESLIFAALGGVAGVLVAYGGVAVLAALAPGRLPRAAEIRVDSYVLLFAATATLLTGAVAGLVPAWRTARREVREGLHEGGRRATSTRNALSRGLIVAQLALSLVLLTFAGLTTRALARLTSVDLGFEPERVHLARVAPARDGAAFFATLLERLSGYPDVEAVGVTSGPPMGDGRTMNEVFPMDGPPTQSVRAEWRIVSADYFRALSIPVLAGRAFRRTDDRRAAKVVVVNQALAALLWGADDPIGKRVSPGGGPDGATVIGVVGDVRMRDPSTPPAPGYYLSLYRGAPPGPMTLVVRTHTDAKHLAASLRAEVKALDPTLPVYGLERLSDLVRVGVAPPRFVAALLGSFGAVALALAAVGLYGVMAYATAQRTHEVGIRVALGAESFDVLVALLRDGGRLVAVGTLLGVAGAFGTSHLMTGLLSDVSPTDPVAFGAAAALLIVVAFFACYLPARRALRISPVVALRSE